MDRFLLEFFFFFLSWTEEKKIMRCCSEINNPSLTLIFKTAAKQQTLLSSDSSWSLLKTNRCNEERNKKSRSSSLAPPFPPEVLVFCLVSVRWPWLMHTSSLQPQWRLQPVSSAQAQPLPSVLIPFINLCSLLHFEKPRLLLRRHASLYVSPSPTSVHSSPRLYICSCQSPECLYLDYRFHFLSIHPSTHLSIHTSIHPFHWASISSSQHLDKNAPWRRLIFSFHTRICLFFFSYFSSLMPTCV